MRNNINSIVSRLNSSRLGLLLFLGLCLMTAVVLATVDKTVQPEISRGAVAVQAKLSQQKLVQGEMSTVYMDVIIETPDNLSRPTLSKSSDIIVVLDRSGSMSGANKMPYAKAAIKELLSRLQENDRFALVSFANNALLHAPLQFVTAEQRQHLFRLVNTVRAGGGTNMSAGLQDALRLVQGVKPGRLTKVLLLSDGQANQGITDSIGLSSIVSQFTERQSVLSSIGMGLDFNETLMSALADYGMGQYAYLEDLASLGTILSANLQDTRRIFAHASELHLTLSDGVELIDAAAYPIRSMPNGSFRVKSGQLLNSSVKHMLLTFKVNAAAPEEMTLGDLRLIYQSQGREQQHSVAPEYLRMAVLTAKDREKVVASIDQDVYQQSWVKNNYGRMQKKLSQWIRSGNKQQAQAVLNEYRQNVQKAELQSAKPLVTPALKDDLNTLERTVAEAFTGEQKEQIVKRKRAAKSIQLDSIKQQRSQ